MLKDVAQTLVQPAFAHDEMHVAFADTIFVDAINFCHQLFLYVTNVSYNPRRDAKRYTPDADDCDL